MGKSGAPPAETPLFSVPIRFHTNESFLRRREPATCGLPWPRGAVRSARQLRLVGPGGRSETVQTRVLERWPDGSVRWCLVDFLASPGEGGGYRIEVVGPAPGSGDEADQPGETPLTGEIDCGALRVGPGGRAVVFRVRTGEYAPPSDVALTITFDGRPATLLPEFRATILERGPVRTRIGFRSAAPLDGLVVFGHADFFAESPVARVQLTLRNTRPAAHPGGNWDLGNPGSLYLRDVTVAVGLPPAAGPAVVRCSPERGQPFTEHAGPVGVYQESSGGENWKHHTHLNRERVVPHRFRGYRLTTPDGTAEGLRATPVVTAGRGGRLVGVTMPHFWENFPKGVAADETGVMLRLFPEASAPHELQGGEQKTHVFYLGFGRDTITDEPLAWCRSPLLAHADPEWYAAAAAVPYLTPAATDPNATYRQLVDQAIDGPDNFFTKRETIDEYGWRNFGDVYADHEAVFHSGPVTLVSHYNNQFDVVRGCGVQFLRSADPRWWDLFLPAADHTCDIDIYHTAGDKAAYNGGLFWQTFHYNDADTGTHRSYPRSLRGSGFQLPGRDLGVMGRTGEEIRQLVASGVGGGPGASHNYNRGLMLAYFLTGNPLYRETAVGLAEFVIRMDAPRPLFRALSGECSGGATASGSADYHGPGRSSANSILALLVGHRLTGRRAFLDKAEELIRRTCHPRQDLDALDLLNAELRWFYTMHLQALGEYLDYKAELGELDRMYAYARLALLHYARWMAANERPVLDRAEKLQYPTETWAAQDVRKVEVFQFAAKHAAGEEKARFLNRAEWFFRYVEQTLAGFPTKSLCRPVNLMMNFGWSHAWWQRHPDATAPEPAVRVSPEEFGEWRMFVPQKAKALHRAKAVAAAGLGVLILAGLALVLL